MNFVKLENSDKFEEFENGSALTFTGIIPEEAQEYVDYFKDYSEVDETVDAYIFEGKLMNEHYNLAGNVRYKNDLHFLVVPLDAFKNVEKVALERFQIGGRWFDDIVANNARH